MEDDKRIKKTTYALNFNVFIMSPAEYAVSCVLYTIHWRKGERIKQTINIKAARIVDSDTDHSDETIISTKKKGGKNKETNSCCVPMIINIATNSHNRIGRFGPFDSWKESHLFCMKVESI